MSKESILMLLNLIVSRRSYYESEKWQTADDERRTAKLLELDRLYGDLSVALASVPPKKG